MIIMIMINVEHEEHGNRWNSSHFTSIEKVCLSLFKSILLSVIPQDVLWDELFLFFCNLRRHFFPVNLILIASRATPEAFEKMIDRLDAREYILC